MKKTINATHIEGYLYNTKKLKEKVTGENSKHPGTKFINGEIMVATDEAMTNIITVHYSYVTPTYGSGSENATYTALKGIIDGVHKTVMSSSKEEAAKVRIDSAIGLNEFYDSQSGELISVKRNEGGFLHIVDALTEDEKDRDTFKCDILIHNVRRVEGDDEKNITEKVVVKGVIFDFRNALLPVEFSVVNPYAMDYYEGLNASNKNPIFTQVRGRQISETIVKTYTDESAFGEADVREVTSTRKDYVIVWGQKEPYEWDTEETMTGAELKEKLAERETYLASVKQRQNEYEASRGNTSASAPAAGAFQF